MMEPREAICSWTPGQRQEKTLDLGAVGSQKDVGCKGPTEVLSPTSSCAGLAPKVRCVTPSGVHSALEALQGWRAHHCGSCHSTYTQRRLFSLRASELPLWHLCLLSLVLLLCPSVSPFSMQWKTEVGSPQALSSPGL